MKMTLLDAIAPITERISKLRIDHDSEVFAAELLKHRPEAFVRVGGTQAAQAAQAIARLVIPELRQIPELVDMLCEKLPKEPAPSVRLAMIVSLAYLVKSNDYLSDDLPACYGYVDDLAVLWAMLGATVIVYNPAILLTPQCEASRFVQNAVSKIRVCSMCVPQNVAPALQRTMVDLLTVVYSLQYEPEELVNARARALMENPFVPIPPPTSLPQSLPPAHADTFALPAGGVGYSGDGMLAYQFDGGDFIALA